MAALWAFLFFFVLWIVAFFAHWVPAALWPLFVTWLVFLVIFIGTARRQHRY
jgi:hypothetical protein